jgi:hypothetical protein
MHKIRKFFKKKNALKHPPCQQTRNQCGRVLEHPTTLKNPATTLENEHVLVFEGGGGAGKQATILKNEHTRSFSRVVGWWCLKTSHPRQLKCLAGEEQNTTNAPFWARSSCFGGRMEGAPKTRLFGRVFDAQMGRVCRQPDATNVRKRARSWCLVIVEQWEGNGTTRHDTTKRARLGAFCRVWRLW